MKFYERGGLNSAAYKDANAIYKILWFMPFLTTKTMVAVLMNLQKITIPGHPIDDLDNAEFFETAILRPEDLE